MSLSPYTVSLQYLVNFRHKHLIIMKKLLKVIQSSENMKKNQYNHENILYVVI